MKMSTKPAKMPEGLNPFFIRGWKQVDGAWYRHNSTVVESQSLLHQGLEARAAFVSRIGSMTSGDRFRNVTCDRCFCTSRGRRLCEFKFINPFWESFYGDFVISGDLRVN